MANAAKSHSGPSTHAIHVAILKRPNVDLSQRDEMRRRNLSKGAALELAEARGNAIQDERS